jgi:hypothetical protein
VSSKNVQVQLPQRDSDPRLDTVQVTGAGSRPIPVCLPLYLWRSYATIQQKAEVQ